MKSHRLPKNLTSCPTTSPLAQELVFGQGFTGKAAFLCKVTFLDFAQELPFWVEFLCRMRGFCATDRMAGWPETAAEIGSRCCAAYPPLATNLELDHLQSYYTHVQKSFFVCVTCFLWYGADQEALRPCVPQKRWHMKVHLLGFSWKMGAVGLDDFFDFLKQHRLQEIDHEKHKRLIYVGERGDYYLGLFLTIRDESKVCEIKAQSGGEYRIRVRKLESGTRPVEFNFFIIHRQTSRGIYQHYYRSCSLDSFFRFCLRKYEELTEERREKELKAAGLTIQEKHGLAAKYATPLRCEQMIRHAALQELLEELATVRYFQFDLAVLQDEDLSLTPLSPLIKTQRKSFTFRRGVDFGAVKKAILKVINTIRPSMGKIIGKDSRNAEKIVKLANNPDHFGEFEFDEVAEEAKLNLGNVSASPFIDQMLEIVRKHKAVFEGT